MAFDVSSRAKRVTVVPDTKLSVRIQPQKEPVISLGKDQDISNWKDLANEFNVDRCSDDIHKWDDYANGQMRYGTSNGFKRLIYDFDKATCGTGMIQDESLILEKAKYKLGVNYRNTGCTDMCGGFGTVAQCQDLKTGRRFAIKKVKREKFNKSEGLMVLIPEHRNVCQMLGIIKNQQIWLLLDWAGESLDKFLCGRRLRCPWIMDLFIQGLEALKHLDQHGLRHMDIKPNNMCIKSDHSGLILRLIDFGTARFSHESTPRSGFTRFYLTPELCKYLGDQTGTETLSSKNDIYQFALVILYIMSGGTHVMKQMAVERCTEKGLEKRDSIKTEYYKMMCSDKHVGEKVVERWCCEEMKLLKPLLLKLITHSPEDRMNATRALKLAKQLLRQLQSTVNSMEDESKPPDKDKRAKFESDGDGTCVKLPELPSLYDKQTSSEDEIYRCGEGNLPLLGELLDSEQNME